MSKTLYEKIFDAHAVRQLDDGQYQLIIGMQLLHDVTSPQAFEDLRSRNLSVRYPERNLATVDHAIPTNVTARPFSDELNEAQVSALEVNAERFGIPFFAPSRQEHGIVHVLGPERGLTQPGMTIACGDSHTSTHGAFGALAIGIGTSQVRDVLATQTIVAAKLKVRRIEVNGELRPGVTAKDIALHLIRLLGVSGGVGYAYEYSGETIHALSMEERMTLCNMSIEGGARCGYVNPDEKTYRYLQGRQFAPNAEDWERAVEFWQSCCTDPGAAFDDTVFVDASEISPIVTWGVNPEQSVNIDEPMPLPDSMPPGAGEVAEDAYAFMGLTPGETITGTQIDVAFIGSCTNGRASDFIAVADLLKRSGKKVAPGVRALAVPGSHMVRDELVAKGVDKILTEAGFEFRQPGCSMCLAINPDKLGPGERCASSSNRNFKGRQGAATGRTHLMSPQMVAAAAVEGMIADARSVFGTEAEVIL